MSSNDITCINMCVVVYSISRWSVIVVQFQMCVICAICYVHAQALKSQDSYKLALLEPIDNNTTYHVKFLCSFIMYAAPDCNSIERTPLCMCARIYTSWYVGIDRHSPLLSNLWWLTIWNQTCNICEHTRMDHLVVFWMHFVFSPSSLYGGYYQ